MSCQLTDSEGDEPSERRFAAQVAYIERDHATIGVVKRMG